MHAYFLILFYFLILLAYIASFHQTLHQLHIFLKLGFTPCKAEQPLQDMELQEKEIQKD